MVKSATPHTLRPSFATYLRQKRWDIHWVQVLPGHRDVLPPMIDTHVLNLGSWALPAPR
ncbi:tyrosine-type recombinase/integrase [Azovibrio restrictus]|uniref:tyrosine-type recombinase/integrase n=1 Tax=Azovibrio restrictus TaxID=146938 RepID=UPI0009FE0CB3|nr:tyrosine-type recombinase/integrase [Azovibrio restrictus]